MVTSARGTPVARGLPQRPRVPHHIRYPQGAAVTHDAQSLSEEVQRPLKRSNRHKMGYEPAMRPPMVQQHCRRFNE